MMAAAPARFLQHFLPRSRKLFETLRVNHPRGELGEESFVELDGVTYLIVSTGNGYYAKDAPFSLFNLETGQEIKSRFANPVSGRDMFGKEIELKLYIRKHTSVSCGNKLAVHFQCGNGISSAWHFEVVYELRDNALHELERTPMHQIWADHELHKALFMDANTLIYANVEGVFMKEIGSDTPNRICSAPHIRPYGQQSENPICMLGANILLKNYIETENDENDDEDEDEEHRFYELYILRPPFAISSSREELGNLSLENLSMISERCSVSTVYENQLVFVRKDDDDDDDDDDDGALHYKWHVMKYTAGSTTGPAKLYSLPPQTIQHYNLEYDGRYIGHYVVTYDSYDNDDRLLVYDTEQMTFMDEYDEDDEDFASYDTGYHLCGWGVVVFQGEEMEIFSHHKSMGFDDPKWKRRKDNKASVFYDSGLNDYEDHCISPNKQYLLLHVNQTSSSKGYRYVMDLQVFYDVMTLLDAYSQHIQPLRSAGRRLEVFNTGPGQAIDFVIRDQMPEIPGIVKRMRDYSEQRKECLKFAPLPPSLANLRMPLLELFGSALQMDLRTSAASAAGNASKKSRRLLSTVLKF